MFHVSGAAEMKVPEEEIRVGITRYASKEPGIDASFRTEPEDFTVEEISAEKNVSENGKYTVFRVKLRNWDTNKYVMKLARELGIYQNRITYAGTKDKRAITIQNFCINGVFDRIPDFKDAEILEIYRTDSPVKLGFLLGNRFQVRLGNCGNIEQASNRIYRELSSLGGFPNYYGLQRFGTMRPITHLVGKFLVLGDFESAVREYICDPHIDHEDFRLAYNESHDAEQALQDFPAGLIFERTLLRRLADGESPERALRAFPRNLTMLFVHAYQSYIFNTALSRRLELVKDMKEILEGDLVIPVDGYFNALDEPPFQCDRFNIGKLNRLSSENRVRPVIKLPGFESRLNQGAMDRIVSDILQEESVKTENFRINGNRTVSSKGSYRIVSAQPVEFSAYDGNMLRFSLGKGIYATVLVREFLKGQALS